MKKLLIVLLLSLSGTLFAQSTPQDLINTFFSTYQKDPGKAVKDLYATNIWTDRIKDDVDKVIGTVNSFTESYMGKYYGYEIITKKNFSESFELYSYALDDGLDAEIQEAAKLYYLELGK